MSAAGNEALALVFDAPLTSFGGTVVDQNGWTGRIPGASQITGLIANALGWGHADVRRLDRLQSRLRMAGAVVKEGANLRDFQTVDLSLPHMTGTGWTTRGKVQERGNGSATSGTHIRYRWYRADEVVAVALTLVDEQESPTLEEVERALSEPFRPLFIGRKCCLPAEQILLGRVPAPTLAEALVKAASLWEERSRQIGSVRVRLPETVEAEWPDDEGGFPSSGFTEARVYDVRDWRNQIHGGERAVRRGRISLKEKTT